MSAFASVLAGCAAGFALAAAAQTAPTEAPRTGREVRAPAQVPGADARMAQLEADMQALEAHMERVRAAADPAERSRLLGEHARALRRTMSQVRELDRAFSPQMRAMMGGGRDIVSAERMMQAHELMARRIALMERLTEQVMEQAMGHGEGAPRK